MIAMATYKVLYWQEIPSQIVAEDDESEISLPLAAKFMEHIESAAMSRGLAGGDDYLAQWRWSEQLVRAGSASDVAEAVRKELESQAEWHE
jgi:hypothetical protein